MKEYAIDSFVRSKRSKNIDLGKHTKEVAILWADFTEQDFDLALSDIQDGCEQYWGGVVVAFDKDGSAVGAGVVTFPDKKRNSALEGAYVLREKRHQGIYTSLLTKRIQIARSLGAESLTLSTNNPSDGILQYYSEKGFVQIDTRNGFLILKKLLI